MRRRTLLIGSGATAALVGAGAVLGSERPEAAEPCIASGWSTALTGPCRSPDPRCGSPPSPRRQWDRRWRGDWRLPRATWPAPSSACTAATPTIGSRSTPSTSARFVAEGSLPVAVAAVDGGDVYWHARADGTDAAALVLDELLPLLPRRAGGAPGLVDGWLRRVAARRWAAPSDPRCHRGGPGGVAPHDPFRLSLAVSARIDCGRDDPFAPAADDLRRVLGAVGGLRDGFHDAATWRSWVPDQLAFAAVALGTPVPGHA